jgi:hypothetical protein
VSVLDTIRRWLEPAVAAGLLLAGAVLGVAAVRWRVRRRIGRRRRMGREGGEKALRILGRAGYRVLDTEVTAHGRVRVDGRERDFHVRADAIVKRGFRRYVAEFKGGAESAAVANRATRRQLLEYSVLFDVSGVLLVDAVRGSVHRIEFPGV